MEAGINNFQFKERGSGLAAITAFGLGTVFGLGFGLATLSESLYDLGLYMMLLAFFHMWEYIYVALSHPGELSWSSFLLNHSAEMKIAVAASWVEYFVEWMFIPSIKGWRLIVYPAFLICVAGQAIRTLAMITAGPNFHHQIREEKEKEHKLVTWGIYSKLRHPSYFGWFWWSIFTQVVLMNPICTVAWGKASWNFFKLRIEVEEETLVEFFKEDYDNYRKRTPVGIPGIL